LPSRGGMIDLEELFRLAGEHRTAELMALAREAVEVAPPHERPELLPYLLLIRNGSGDAGDRFARAMVLDLSGLAGNTPGPEVEAWLKRWRQLGVWAGERAEEGVEEMGRILRDRESSIVLQLAAIDGLVRIGSLEGVSPLLDALASVRPEVRSSAHRGLEALLGAGLPFHPNAREETRAVEIVSWRAYWQREGDNLRIRRRWEGLRDALERGRDPAERARVRRAIAALGPAVLPEIEEIIESPSFAFDWLLVWEAITGKRRGF
ncbi:MAG: hypothetical protein ACE5GW_11030, partial [Planctomycetota bacterium]